MTTHATSPFYVRADGGGTGERMSEPLARWESAHNQGVAEASLRLLQCAVWTARDVMRDDEVRAAFEAAIGAAHPSAVFDVEPKVPEWGRGLLEDDARFRQLTDAELTTRIKIPTKLVALVREGVLATMASGPTIPDPKNWRADAWQVQRCVEIVDLLDAHAGNGAVRLTLNDGQARQLGAAIDHIAAKVEDNARDANDGAEILKFARVAAKLRTLRATIASVG